MANAYKNLRVVFESPLDSKDSLAPENLARLYRLVTEEHVCPYGLKSKALLEREGFVVEDHWLTTREEARAFRRKHNVETTPQTFVNGERIGGYDDLRKYFGKPLRGENETSYQPIVAIFSMALFMALSVCWLALGTLFSPQVIVWFVSIAMCILGIQKLQDVESFSSMFLNYDLLARRNVRYAYIYPFGEALAGVLMLAGALLWLAAPIALFIGGIGAVSVFKAVYIDKRELKCACVGGSSKVPLGFVSLTENLMMVAMGVWMSIKLLVLS